jgi:hypothetical protein
MITPADLLLAARLWTAIAAVRDVPDPAELGASPVAVVRAARIADVDPALALAVMWRESRGRPKARAGSHLGPMQVSSRWHCKRTDCGGTLGQVSAGVYTLRRYVRRWGLRDGLAVYKNGAGNRSEAGWYADQVLSLYRHLEAQ